MGCYQTILENLPLEHKKIWYRNWKYTVAVDSTIPIPLFLYMAYIAQKMAEGVYCHTCILTSFLILLAYDAMILYPHMTEKNLNGWKMDTLANARVSALPVIIFAYGALTAWFVYYSITYIPALVLMSTSLAILMIAVLVYIIYDAIGGYRMKKTVPRKYNIPDLDKEIRSRLKIAFPNAELGKRAVRIGELKLRIKNEQTLNSVGGVEIMGIKPSNLESVKKIMEIVDMLG